MKFLRNVFYPIRLIFYPVCLQIFILMGDPFLFDTILMLVNVLSLVLLAEAVFELVMPYIEWHGNEITIYSNLLFKTKIDLSGYTADDIAFEDWFVNIGPHSISLRRIRAGYRERFEEGIEKYFGMEAVSTESEQSK